MMEIDIVGEDQVTQEIIVRLLTDLRGDILIKNRLPARGSQIKNSAPKFNSLASPVFMLTDLDTYNCPPELIMDWFGTTPINPQMLFRIAREEAETWLMADREGFSKWLEIEINLIPEPQLIDRRSSALEIIFPLKPSLYMMMNMASQSKNKVLKDALMPMPGAKKGPGYNSAILPFIKDIWNIENAAKNSDSLSRAISRLRTFQLIT